MTTVRSSHRALLALPLLLPRESKSREQQERNRSTKYGVQYRTCSSTTYSTVIVPRMADNCKFTSMVHSQVWCELLSKTLQFFPIFSSHSECKEQAKEMLNYE